MPSVSIQDKMIKHPLIDHIPITGDMVSLWIPSGQNRAIDIIRSNHGQCFGTHPNVPVLPNIINTAVGWHFDNIDNVIVVPNSDSLNPTEEITVGAWIYPITEEDIYKRIIDKDATTTFTLALFSKILWAQITGTVVNSDPNIVSIAEWQLVGYTYHGTDRAGKFFLNAQEAGDMGDLGALGTNVVDLRIGNLTVRNRTFDGYIVFPFLTNKVWSQQRWENFYLGTRSFFAPRG